ncbi:glycoside hydrolase [Coprinopsis sp. MPI-PUGE-AT-0042]|nr:glycoside hydrolase [Coprinopsis sp. MPI-PUGE-AT-0042]
MKLLAGLLLSFAASASAHYTFASLVVNGQVTTAWQYVRKTNNFQSNGPVTDVNSQDFRCYNSQTRATAQTYSVNAGSRIGFNSPGSISHPSTTNIYMARAPSGVDVANWDGSGQVWFKVHEIHCMSRTVVDQSPSLRTECATLSLPSLLLFQADKYLVRIENVALHSAQGAGGAQWYISCAQVNVQGGGSGNPGPLVSIPGVYNGREPGIMINIYYPVPSSYVQPGPAVWRG